MGRLWELLLSPEKAGSLKQVFAVASYPRRATELL